VPGATQGGDFPYRLELGRCVEGVETIKTSKPMSKGLVVLLEAVIYNTHQAFS
jgi:hypothetical protein